MASEKQGVVVDRVGICRHSLDECWQEGKARLGLVLADVALREVERGALAMVHMNGRCIIMMPGEAERWQG